MSFTRAHKSTPTRKPPLWHFGYSDDIRMQGHYNVAREVILCHWRTDYRCLHVVLLLCEMLFYYSAIISTVWNEIL